MDLDDTLSSLTDDSGGKQKRLFVLGLIILFGWMIVIVLCAYPQLFRDLLLRYVCCCFAKFAARKREKERQQAEKVAKAQERVRSASKSFISVSMAANPSAILLKQLGLAEPEKRRGTAGGGEDPLLFEESQQQRTPPRISASEPPIWVATTEGICVEMPEAIIINGGGR